MSSFNDNQIKFIIFQIEIPIPLDVLDSTERDDIGKPYLVLHGNIVGEIRTKRVYHEDLGDNCKIGPAKISVDRFGKLSHTQIQVWFHKDAVVALGFDPSDIYSFSFPLLPIVLIYVNKFLQTYKLATNEYWIPAITNSDILGFRCSFIDEDRNEDWTIVPICQTTQGNGGEPFSLGVEKDKVLRDLLITNNVDLQRSLNLAAIDHYTKGEYNLALIQCAILFENVVYFTLKKKLSNTKLKKLKVKEGCGCHLGIYEVCTRGMRDVYGIDFGGTQVFIDFKETVITPRNKIVHGDQLEQISQKHCEKALDNTKAVIDSFIKAINSVEQEK